MKAERITISPFQFTRITECLIEKEVNSHGFAKVRGYIPPDMEQAYLTMACSNMEVAISAVNEVGESNVIYCGILEDLQITHKNSVCIMEIKIVPYTYLMDLTPTRRSFQIQEMPYQSVLDIVMAGYEGGAALMNVGGDAAIGEPVVQYQETDWEFVKRISSYFNTVVTPSYTTSGAKLYVGLVEWPGASRMNPVCYQARKAVNEYLYKEQNQVEGIVEDDSLWYVVEDQELYEVGEMVSFQERVYYIARVESRLDGHQLWNTYSLKTLAGFKVPKQYNDKIIGASLDGVITAVSADVVRVQLNVDGAAGAGKWFPFSTVYSSPDGSGWYCMPEPGDEIRLYFPTEREKHGYVISSVHLPVTGTRAASSSGASGSRAGSTSANTTITSNNSTSPGASRSDPTHKTIYTSSNKMVDLAETYILLDTGTGMRIRLDDNEGITIISSKGVKIKSDKSVDITSLGGKVEVAGMTSVDIKQNGSKMSLSAENVIISGANAKVQ